MPPATRLAADIASWDGRSASGIRRVHDRHADAENYPAELVRLAADRELEVGATWLLKHHLENGGPPPAAPAVDALFAGVNRLGHWEARLHLLQCLAYLDVPPDRLRAVQRFLAAGRSDDRPFVRAWAFSGTWEIARSRPRLQARARALLEDALDTESAASVGARIRRVLKEAR